MTRVERFVNLLPRLGQPVSVRFGFASLIMAVAVVLELLLKRYLGLPGLSPLLLGAFACAVLFARGSGLYAAAIACGAAYYSFSTSRYHTPMAPAIIMFSAVCLGVAASGEALRLALEGARTGAHNTAILLRELRHRTQNTLAIVVAMLELQSRASEDRGVKDALGAAADRVRVQSEAYRHLDLRDPENVSADEYLGGVCRLLEKSLSGMKRIRIDRNIPKMMIEAQKALALGLILNEVVTNAVKYAFEGMEEGLVTVTLDRDDTGMVRLRVADDGSGCPEHVADGVGTQLIQSLAKQHNGSFERTNLAKGCEVIVKLAKTRTTR